MIDKKQKHQQLVAAVKASGHSQVKLAITDIDGVLRGKTLHLDKFLNALENGFGFCDVVFGWDIADRCYDASQLTGWHTGYPDVLASIAPETFRQVPWDESMPFFLADFRNADSAHQAACPRSLLQKIGHQASKMGLTPLFSQEFEWFTFHQPTDSDPNLRKTISSGMFGYSLLRAGANRNYFNGLFKNLQGFGVPLEGLHTETGPGVYEGAIQANGILEAADRAVLLKAGVKEIANLHGFTASFMAKWSNELPGCGGHIHQSLWDSEGSNNLFWEASGQPTELFKQYLAGQLACLPEIMPMLAPTINSYKRLLTGDWAPATFTWGFENRTAALRVIQGSPKQSRLENRIPGADVNPYLAMAACLAAGLYGITNKLQLQCPPAKGNAYQQKGIGSLPRSLAEATAVMKNSSIAKTLFGEGFIKHFVETREWECAQYEKQVTDWEFNRYFEPI